jgi:hypothetical protein
MTSLPLRASSIEAIPLFPASPQDSQIQQETPAGRARNLTQLHPPAPCNLADTLINPNSKFYPIPQTSTTPSLLPPVQSIKKVNSSTKDSH